MSIKTVPGINSIDAKFHSFGEPFLNDNVIIQDHIQIDYGNYGKSSSGQYETAEGIDRLQGNNERQIQ